MTTKTPGPNYDRIIAVGDYVRIANEAHRVRHVTDALLMNRASVHSERKGEEFVFDRTVLTKVGVA